MASREVLVITGCGGMGAAVARRLGAGRNIVLADYNKQALETVVAELRAEGHQVTAVVTDVSNRLSVRNLALTSTAQGRIKIIVHTAGVSPVQATPKQIVDVDVVGTANVIDEFLGLFEPDAVLICIASMAGTLMPLTPDVEKLLANTPTDDLSRLDVLNPEKMDPGSAYSLAKRANQLRVQAASLSWGKRGGRVVSISPGIISTPMGQQELSGPSGEAMKQMIELSPTQRIGTPEDIANAVAWLADPASSFITGTDILVDGGVVAAIKAMS